MKLVCIVFAGFFMVFGVNQESELIFKKAASASIMFSLIAIAMRKEPKE